MYNDEKIAELFHLENLIKDSKFRTSKEIYNKGSASLRKLLKGKILGSKTRTEEEIKKILIDSNVVNDYNAQEAFEYLKNDGLQRKPFLCWYGIIPIPSEGIPLIDDALWKLEESTNTHGGKKYKVIDLYPLVI